MKIVAVKGQLRSDLGKQSAKAVRREELIPCVLYGGDEVVHFSTNQHEVKDIVYTPDFKIAEIQVDGATYRCILKDVQFHPVTDEILHIDFLRLIDGTPIKVELPVRFKGTAPGVKSGGKVMRKVRRVKVKTLPEKLVDELLLDVSKLHMGDSIRIRDIETVEGMEILNSPGIPVATVEVPRAMRSLPATAAAAEGEEEEEGEEGAEGGEEQAGEE